MHAILQRLRARDLAPALQWVQEHRSKLGTGGERLEFSLHRMEYMRHLMTEVWASLAPCAFIQHSVGSVILGGLDGDAGGED